MGAWLARAGLLLAFAVVHFARALNTPTSTMASAVFPFVHPSIAHILECRGASSAANTRASRFLDTSLLNIQEWPSASMSSQAQDMPQLQKDALVQLALECDDYVFVRKGLAKIAGEDDAIGKMISWGMTNDRVEDNYSKNSQQYPTAQLLLASLLGLNRLEAAIRHATGHTTAGRSPLLKTMIQVLHEKEDDRCVAEILQALLLPSPGLNLRNLLWHGFVASLPRPWLALVLVLVCILERDYPALKSAVEAAVYRPTIEIPRLRQYSEFGPILRRGEELLLQGDLDASWMSQAANSNAPLQDTSSNAGSYGEWWELITSWVETKQYPLCTCILMTCLIEHILRQQWCGVNDRNDDSIANPGLFYVTLDGHGQRHQHDVMLHPYVGGSDDPTKSCLGEHLGGHTMALLTDLYCSPCGGPNLRASLSHGLWDAYLQEELGSTSVVVHNNDTKSGQEAAWDLVQILLTLMEEMSKSLSTATTAKSGSPLGNYRPIFSYTAATCRNLDSAMKELQMLERPFTTVSGKESLQLAKAAANLPLESIHELKISLGSLQERASTLNRVCGYSDSGATLPWRSHDIFLEHETNQVLASMGAARSLLLEVADACATFRTTLELALVGPENGASSRQRKQRLRNIAASELATTVYGFAAMTAILLLEHDLSAAREGIAAAPSIERAVLLQAVKRSRMVVSTVSTFICANTDRAVKAANDYSQGKGVQAITK